MVSLTIEEITQYWLLTSAIEFPRGLEYFFPAVDDIALNMGEVSGLNAEDYVNALLALFDLGMIEFSSNLLEDDVTTRSGILNILDRFLKFSSENPNALMIRRARPTSVPDPYAGRTDLKVRFRLTEKGGEAWEKIAEPDWDHFFDQRSDYETGEIYSRDLTLLIARLGWWGKLNDTRIDINTIEMQTHSEFQVLYWKTLPNVYRATFSLAQTESCWTNGRIGEPKWFRDWWHSTTEWFTKPRELPEWPASIGI
jgi:hypothetical protein